MPVEVQLRFHKKELCYGVNSPIDPTKMNVCFRTFRKPFAFERTKKEYDIETIYFYYTQNLAMGCWGTYIQPTSEFWGFHDHDVEKVSILYEPGTEDPQWVYFSAHSMVQGTWMAWEDCQKTPEGRLVIYVARSSHASYPTPGLRLRIFGFANDTCNSTGRHIDLDAIPAVDWKSENGVSLSSQPITPPQQSITFFRRFFATYAWPASLKAKCIETK